MNQTGHQRESVTTRISLYIDSGRVKRDTGTRRRNNSRIMISDSYDFTEFLQAIMYKDFLEMLESAQQECAEAESRPYTIMGNISYSRKLNNFIFFLEHRLRPLAASDQEFALYIPICEALIQKKHFTPAILNLFK